MDKHIPATEQSLATVYNQIVKIISLELAQVKAKDLGTKLINITDAKQQQELLTANKLSWQEIKNAARDHDKSNAVINDLAFNISKPESREGTTLPNGDYLVVKLKTINNGDLSTLDQEQKNSLVQQIVSTYGMLDYDLYVNNLLRQAKIERF